MRASCANHEGAGSAVPFLVLGKRTGMRNLRVAACPSSFEEAPLIAPPTNAVTTPILASDPFFDSTRTRTSKSIDAYSERPALAMATESKVSGTISPAGIDACVSDTAPRMSARAVEMNCRRSIA